MLVWEHAEASAAAAASFKSALRLEFCAPAAGLGSEEALKELSRCCGLRPISWPLSFVVVSASAPPVPSSGPRSAAAVVDRGCCRETRAGRLRAKECVQICDSSQATVDRQE